MKFLDRKKRDKNIKSSIG